LVFDDYLPENNQHENYLEFEAEFQKEICSCGHKVIDCDCKAGCKCGCNKRFLGAY
jgi:hypothetical protein